MAKLGHLAHLRFVYASADIFWSCIQGAAGSIVSVSFFRRVRFNYDLVLYNIYVLVYVTNALTHIYIILLGYVIYI